MKPKRLHVPSPVHHKPSGRDVLFLRDADGKRRTIPLGKHGSPEAERRYREVLAEHLAGKPITGPTPRAPSASKWPTVGQLAAAYLLHAQRFYVDEAGRPTGEVTHATYAFSMLKRLFRDIPTNEITVRDLLTVRQALIDSPPTHQKGRRAPNGLSRRTINDRMHRVKRLFRWGVEQGIVPGSTWHELSALRSLPKGRGGVHDNPPVEPVAWPLVETTLTHMVPTLAAAVKTQWWTGMRPAEVLAMTRRQLDTTGATWLYRLAKHKGSWRGRDRVVAIGPKAQEILRPLLRLEQDAPLFSGRAAWEEFRAAKRAGRETPETKQMRERDERAAVAEAPAEFVSVDEYRRAIERACDKAGVPHWSPHRLRHAAGTRIAQEEGLEAARCALGHADLTTTWRYAVGADVEIAKRTAARLG